MANADPDNKDNKLRSLGVWNGLNRSGGMSISTLLNMGRMFSNMDFGGKGISQFQNWKTVLSIVQKTVDLWNPVLASATIKGYQGVFDDRPAIGWMLYLPFAVKTEDVPIAPAVIPVMKDKKQQGTIIVSVTDTFDVNNPEHIKRAHDIEIMLVDKDLLPTRADFVRKF
jgi:hypothetical protein